METLYHQTNKLVQETQHLFSQLETRTSSSEVEGVQEAIESKINLINSNCERLDVLCLKGPVSQRQNARMRVDQLKYDSRHLSAALTMWRNRMIRQERERTEREALLAKKFTTNDHVDIMIDHSMQHNNSLQNAVHGMDDLLHQGSSVLENLRSQRVTLKGAHKRLIDIGNALGLSNTTMRLIEQRARQDGFILIAGMTLTCIIIILVIVYLS